MNANPIIRWLSDPRDALAPPKEPDAACFLPVEIVDRPMRNDNEASDDPAPAVGMIEIDLACVHRLRISGAYDPAALARLIRRLSG